MENPPSHPGLHEYRNTSGYIIEFFFYILLRASPIFNLLIINKWCMRDLIDDGMLNSFVSWNYDLNGQVADLSIS